MFSDHILERLFQALTIEAWSLNKKTKSCTLLLLASVNTAFILLADGIQYIVHRHEWYFVTHDVMKFENHMSTPYFIQLHVQCIHNK